MKNSVVLIICMCLALASCKKEATNTIEQNGDKTAKFIHKSSNETFEAPKFQKDEMEYSSNILIDDTSRWQLIASSQNYGSNYAVFAKFYTENDSENNLIVKQAEFKLLNYKNLIPIGIDNVQMIQSTNGIEMKIFVQAQGKYRGQDKGKKLSNLNVAVIKGGILHTERIILPMHIISQTESRSREEKQFSKHDFKFYDENGIVKDSLIYYEADNNQLFDTEFFYKDGIHVNSKKHMDESAEKKVKAPGKRCRDAYFIILASN